VMTIALLLALFVPMIVFVHLKKNKIPIQT
jgi:hypothetical protein